MVLGTMEQRPWDFRQIVFMCVVLHNMLRTQSGAPTPGNDGATLQNEQVVHVANENYRNPLREAKQQQGLLNNYSNHVGALSGQGDRI